MTMNLPDKEIDPRILAYTLRHLTRLVQAGGGDGGLHGSAGQHGENQHISNQELSMLLGTPQSRARAINEGFNALAAQDSLLSDVRLPPLTLPRTPAARTLTAGVAAVAAAAAASSPGCPTSSSSGVQAHPAPPVPLTRIPAAPNLAEAAPVSSTGCPTSASSEVQALMLASPSLADSKAQLEALAAGHTIRGFVCTHCDHYNVVKEEHCD
ncbi:hypothetical protein NLJ89_g3090 [Agrocybe chaxingu]|uniref:Uncharacterized protein n=1 Tax=Agrocybe chaxingu TaxID=84603 RepID=A0A9W8MVU2_9AGAR|nr:hypothetical protein NLJ89_g3090 [Agrocybe chaxingu]